MILNVFKAEKFIVFFKQRYFTRVKINFQKKWTLHNRLDGTLVTWIKEMKVLLVAKK